MMARPIRSAYEIPSGAAFGAQRAGGARRHNATDYHAPPGTPVYATGRGVVRHVGYNGDAWLGLGHNITIDYDDGSTLDGHLQASPTAAHGLRASSRVTENTRIGSVGRTGNAVNADPKGPWNGNHLHHERRNPKGLLVNPEVYYGAAPAYAAGVPIITIGGDDMLTPTQEAQLLEIWHSVMPGREGVKTIGPLAKMAAAAESHAASAAADAKRAADLVQGLVADFRQGQEGSHHAGRLYLMLANASGGTPVNVDPAAIARELAPLINTNTDLSAEEIATAVADELHRRTAN